MSLFGITLGKQSQRLLRVVGYVALGLVSFVFALQMTFPYSRVKDRISEVLSTKYDVVIGGVERGWMPGKMILTNVSLKTRPTQANQVPTLFYIKELSLDLGVLALLGKKAVVDVEATIGNGTLLGQVSLAKDRVKIRFHSDSLPGVSLPLKELVSLPVIGKIALDVDFDLRLVRNTVDWTKALGHLQLECPSGCTVGDGKTKIRPQVTRPNQAEFVKDGIEFNKLNLDKLLVRLEIKKGVAKITKWDVPSKDGEVHLDFEAVLDPVLLNSVVSGCLRYNSSKELEERDYRTSVQLKTLGAPLGPDNLFHIRLQGPLRMMKRLAQICGPAVDGKTPGSGGSGNSGNSGDSGGRPNPSFNPPDEAIHPVPSVPQPMPEVPPPQPQPMPPPSGMPPPGMPTPSGTPPAPLPPVTATQPNEVPAAGSAVPAPAPPPVEVAPQPGPAPLTPSAPQIE